MFNITWALLLVSLALWFFKTEQLSYLKEIERKNGELEKINQTKEKLFSIIAHDLRSPIAQLKGSLDLLNHEYISPEKFAEMALRISDHVDQLHNTLDNLLRWSLSQLQGITAHPEKTELASIINDRFSILQQKMEEKNISLVINDLQQTVWVDPDHLRLIVRNLLSNAIKYSYRNGNILVTSRSENDLVTLIIEDHGIGMSEGMRKDIFHPDIIYSKPGTENEKGTGLGLRLCKEFVEKNNGRISVESEENMGSRFFVSLPAAIAEYTD
jgi:signal transduction histidine kinase